MPAPTVTVLAPIAGHTHADPASLRPGAAVSWTGGTGPFDVDYEWDTDSGFGSPITVTNTSATSPDQAVPTSDLGPAGTTWYFRARVTDTSDSAATTTTGQAMAWSAADLKARFLSLLSSVGVGFTPTDDPAGGWGPDPDEIGPDGATTEFARYLSLFSSVGVGFTPYDDPAGGWGPDPDEIGPDGDNRLQWRYLYLLAALGVGFDPTDTPAGGWDPEATGNPLIGPGDDLTNARPRFLYFLANINTDTPTPHIWYLFPTFGREGWQFDIIGYGFGDTQAEYSAPAPTLDGLAVGVVTWQGFAETDPDLIIDPIADIATPIHQRIEAVVPVGAESGLVIVCTDGP